MKFALQLFGVTIATLLSAALGFKLGHIEGCEDQAAFERMQLYQHANSKLSLAYALEKSDEDRAKQLKYLQSGLLQAVLAELEKCQAPEGEYKNSFILLYREYFAKKNLSPHPLTSPGTAVK